MIRNVLRWFRRQSQEKRRVSRGDGDRPAVPDGGVAGDTASAGRPRDVHPDAGEEVVDLPDDAASHERVVGAAFDELRERLDGEAHEDLRAVEAELSETLAGLDDETGAETPTSGAFEMAQRLGVGGQELLNHVGIPLFVVDDEANILVWNDANAELFGVTREEARELDMLSEAFYHEGRRAMTLADKVLEAPRRTDVEFDVGRVEGVDFHLYEGQSQLTDAHGRDLHVDFRAAPLFDGDGDLAGVIELIHDRTDDARRHEQTRTVVAELTETMEALGEGELGARATIDVDTGYVDEELLAVVDPFNDLAERLETIVDRVDTQAEKLARAVDESASAADSVQDHVVEQREMLGDTSDEIQSVSASMEEIAATSDQVASAADQAHAAATDGAEASEDLRDVTDDLTARSQDLVDSVEGLNGRMDEIEEIVGVIADVAEQTNMLALNANIEAARAGEAGEGFAVVADEVKTLATETSEYTDEISENIDGIQEQTVETVAAVESSHERIVSAEQRVEEALDALEAIVDAVEDVTHGVNELSDANDDQADTIEGITTSVEDVNDRAADAEEAVTDIVEAMDRQTETVSELTDSVRALYDTR
jgi:methyl-accepting chemotaxis protein